MEQSDAPLAIQVVFAVGYVLVIAAFVRLAIIGLRGGPVFMLTRGGHGGMQAGTAARIMGGVYLLLALFLVYMFVRALVLRAPGT